VRQGKDGLVAKRINDGLKAFSETDFHRGPESITVPDTRLGSGFDDQDVPSLPRAFVAKLLKKARSKSMKDCRTAICTTLPVSSTSDFGIHRDLIFVDPFKKGEIICDWSL